MQEEKADKARPGRDEAAGAGDPTSSLTGSAATGSLPPEVGGPRGPEPTRYGDWEVKGRCSDF